MRQGYPKYKDSEVEWIGAIPSSWDIRPLFTVASESKISNKGMIENNLLSLSYGRIIRKDIDALGGLLPESFETYQVVNENDIIFRLTDLQNDKRSLRSAICGERGIITSAYVAVTPKKIRPKFVHYLMRSYDETKVFYNLGSGMRQSLKYDELRRLPLVTPPESDQEQIEEFLDRETARIDNLIAEKQTFIKLLKEKRQALISHVVTKGINPDVKMKDSGIEWIGEVPEHWEVFRLKRVAKMVGGNAFKSSDFQDNGVQLIRIGNLYQNKLCLDRQPVFLPAEYLDYHNAFVVSDGDVLMSLTGTLGKKDYGFAIKLYSNDKYLLNQRVGKLVFDTSKMSSSFALSTLHSESYLNQLYSLPFGTKQANLSNDDVLAAFIAVPPTIEEQKQISDYLQSALKKYEDVECEVRESIVLLQEHRAALISAAVTGKIDVRNQ